MRCFTRLSSLAAVLSFSLFLCLNTAHAAVDTPNEPPEDPPYYGGYYITGVCSLGVVTIYLPVSDGWCVDANGFLFRYGSSSASGVMYDSSGTKYTFNSQAFSLPRYRNAGSNTGTYTDLYLTPSYSNVVIEDSFSPSYGIDRTIQLVILASVGLIFIVLISKGR